MLSIHFRILVGHRGVKVFRTRNHRAGAPPPAELRPAGRLRHVEADDMSPEADAGLPEPAATSGGPRSQVSRASETSTMLAAPESGRREFPPPNSTRAQ